MTLDGEKHVMLSYNWNSQALVSKIHDILIDEGIKVWMDINGGMGDNINISMAEGVENATVVCCFMTPDYQKSHNCQLELEYANKKEIRIIPCMLGDKSDRKWKPSSWLGLITGGLQYINLRDDSDSNIQLRARELIDRIKNQSSASTTKLVLAPIKLFEPIRDKTKARELLKGEP
ncbi:unnamed protein product [Rotaria sp. Silwood1]|nr:unnamed protein product [Rotaria sp. Silwood1]